VDFERIAREVASGLLDPLLERRDYGGNQLDKGGGGHRKHVLRKKPAKNGGVAAAGGERLA
jgi:hypothetical protein